MLAEMRSAVTDLLESQGLPFDIHGYVPGDVTMYPCIVVGRPNARESAQARTIADVELDVYVCGREQSDDAQEELDKAADQVWAIFGGTRQRRQGDLVLAAVSITASVIAVAGTSNVPAYVFSIQSALATC
jgi:hypothetical protein